MTVGTEWLVDASGCSPDALRSLSRLQSLFARVVADLELKAVGEAVWHVFPGQGGVTGVLLLQESHLACHTYPELGVATINLYCCRERPAWNWEERLAELLEAGAVTVRRIERRPASDAADSRALERVTGTTR
jgi:S-adenosylmethionine decarboxylase